VNTRLGLLGTSLGLSPTATKLLLLDSLLQESPASKKPGCMDL